MPLIVIKKACKKLGFNLINLREVAKMLEWTAYKYSVEDYNKKCKQTQEVIKAVALVVCVV